MQPLLDSLALPEALHEASLETLEALSQEIRDRIIDVVPRTGGHLGTNLGVVELTLALHRVYDFRYDRIVFDVGHQAYPHKLVTGRNPDFEKLRQKDGLCGFPSPEESHFDNFLVGHAGTSVSSALGLVLGYGMQKDPRKTVAIIGDGSMCGLAFEGFNQAGELKKNMLVILNDNKMAISPTVGAFSKHLNRLRSGDTYTNMMKEMKHTLQHIPMIGESLEGMREKMLLSLKEHLLSDRFFSNLGFNYFGPVDGHNLEELIPMLENLKEHDEPVLLHVMTEKGKGAHGADQDPYKFHSPPSPPKKKVSSKPKALGWSEAFTTSLHRQAEKDERLFAITAAMAAGTKLEAFIEAFPDRSIDTGIAEAHAVTMAGGLAVTGARPVVLIYSTFLQRAYDSIMHDVCLQPHCPVIFAIDRAGLVGDDGPSHHGVFDIAYLRHLPGMVLMAPRDDEELEMMFQWSLKQNQPVAIRYPRGNVPEFQIDLERPAIEPGVPERLKEGGSVAICAYGAMLPEALEAEVLLKEAGVDASVYNLRFAKPLKEEAYEEIFAQHDLVVTVEDHVLMGGIGSAILETVSLKGVDTSKMLRLGIPDAFVAFMSRPEQLASLGLDGVGISKQVLDRVSSSVAQEA